MDVSATDADNDRPNDALSSSATRTVTFADDDIDGPVIVLGGSPPPTETDGQTQNFTWNVTDASGLSAFSVEIRRNGTIIYSTTGTGAAISSYNFDAHGLGTYTIAVSATDADNDRPNDSASSAAGREVVVTDDDTTPPVIVLTGSEGAETDGQTQQFTWAVTDGESAPGQMSVSVQIFKQGNPTPIHTSSSATGNFNFDVLGLGTYTINVAATSDTDWAGDSLSSTGTRMVIVADDDTAGPAIVLGGSTGSETDGQTQNFTWNISDPSRPGESFRRNQARWSHDLQHHGARRCQWLVQFRHARPGHLHHRCLGHRCGQRPRGRLAFVLRQPRRHRDRRRYGPAAHRHRRLDRHRNRRRPERVHLERDRFLGPVGPQHRHSGRHTATTIFSTTSTADAVGSYNFDGPGLGTYTIAISATDADNDRADDMLSVLRQSRR